MPKQPQTRLQELLKLYPKREVGQASYAAILVAADNRISQNGIDGVNISNIIAEAGVSPGTLYTYFPDPITDLAIILLYYRQRRIKHAIRNVVHYAVMLYELPEAWENGKSTIPIYFTIYLILHGMFKVLREKPALDQELIGYLQGRRLPMDTIQEDSIVKEIEEAINIMTAYSLNASKVHNIATIITYGTRGTVFSWMRHKDLTEIDSVFVERTLVQMYALMLAQQISPDLCAECRMLRKFSPEQILSGHKSTKPHRADPITCTVPTDEPSVDLQLTLQMLQQLRNAAPPRSPELPL